MMTSLKSLLGYRLEARDGLIGKVYDFHFDNGTWGIRHVAAETHAHIPWPKVMIAREALGVSDWVNRTLIVDLLREEIKHAPHINHDPPLYRQIEEQQVNFYTWATHWTPFSGIPAPEWKEGPIGGVELRSLRHLLGGYAVFSHDGELMGHVTDFLADDEDWQIHLMVLEREGVAKQVVLPVETMSTIHFPEHRILLSVDAGPFFDAPEYNALQLRNPHFCEEVRAHFRQETPRLQPA